MGKNEVQLELVVDGGVMALSMSKVQAMDAMRLAGASELNRKRGVHKCVFKFLPPVKSRH